jgi:hypothetical protein
MDQLSDRWIVIHNQQLWRRVSHRFEAKIIGREILWGHWGCDGHRGVEIWVAVMNPNK